MSKIKKVAIGILSGIMIIFGIQSMSNAYSVGQRLTITYNQYISSNNIFCVERGQALTADNNYNIISNVKIEGIKSTDYQGKTIDSWHNAKFAYILSANNGTSHDSGPVQNELWNYGYTWMNNVGKNHNGLSQGFISSVKGNNDTLTTNLDKEATNYADNIENGKKVTDNTKKDNIKVEMYNKDETQYMRIGPFNWSFAGKLTEISVYNQDSNVISETLYSTFNGTTENWINVEDIKSNSDFYISIPADSGVSKITKVQGKMNVDVKAVNIWFLESTTTYKQNLIIAEPYNTTEEVNVPFDYDISILGHLKVIKVNKDNQQVTLAGVGFYIQNKNTGKYVKQEADGTVSYVENKDQATEFITDKNGEITIKNLTVGTYIAYETKNPNYGYEIISEGKEKDVVVDKTAELKIPNKQKYIKLSGYVWVDNISGKQSTINHLYDMNNSEDMLLDGITVRLINKVTGETIKDTITSNGGKYLFTDVLVDNLDKYYIEFEYDGLKYTNVVPHIDMDNGSKSAENTTVRDNFNKDFSVVEGKSQNESVTKDTTGKETHTLTYNTNQVTHKSTLIKIEPESMVKANTEETGYSIKDHYVPGQEEIKYINLGLYEREQPDISLVKDLHSVNISINGYNNIYNYAQRFKEEHKPTENDLNVGVKYKDEYTGSYSRAIYKADYIYNDGDTTENSKNLKVYLTYKIRLINETAGLKVKVNSIVDYFDKDYTLKQIGTKIDEKGTITEKLSHNQIGDVSEYNNNYSKIIINTDTEIDSQGMSDIYVQFELNREAILKILGTEETPGTGETLDNVAEINSYSVLDKNGKAYAGIDKDSNPGNAVPGDTKTYEDDTDSAPSLKLEVSEARKMTGKVFLDESTGGIGLVRQGDGEYKEGEKGIEGVEVTLAETTGTNQVYKATTDANGDFLFEDFIPGDYTLTYTWGNETYTVQNYKGTIYRDSNRANNKEWYKTITPRYSDALDDYELRKTIDNESTTNKMNSTTPIMSIGVENVDTVVSSIGNRYEYIISNIDFGIVERARQELDIGKRVEKLKVTLANGQVITDITIKEDGTIEGKTNYVAYMGPSSNTIPNNGFIKLELDNELIQGATVNIQYAIAVTNNSELDYDTAEYYLYGKQGTDSQIIKYIPSEIYDYLDNTLVAEENSSWEIKEISAMEEMKFTDKTILYNKEGTIEILPGTSKELAKLNTSKVLANIDEISLNNDVEITKVTRKGETGRTLEIDKLYDSAETVIITPPTGEELNVVVPIIVGIASLIILAVGVVLIKKKTL